MSNRLRAAVSTLVAMVVLQGCSPQQPPPLKGSVAKGVSSADPPAAQWQPPGMSPAAGYAAWIKRFTPPVPQGGALVLRVPAERVSPWAADPDSDPAFRSYTVDADGSVTDIRSIAFGFFGGRNGSVTAAVLGQLREVAATLPPDAGHLPPAQARWLLVEADCGHGQRATRVYDKSNLPDAMLRLLDVVRSGIEPDVTVAQPVADINAARRGHGGFLTLAPDCRSLVFQVGNDQPSRWQPTTRRPLGAMPLANVTWKAFAISPDGSRAFVSNLFAGSANQSADLIVDPRTWTVVGEFRDRESGPPALSEPNPRFTPDGKFLFVGTDLRPVKRDRNGQQKLMPGLRVYDTTTGRVVAMPPFLPSDCVGYRPAAAGALAVVERDAGGVVLWDVEHRRAAATLDADARLADAAFSPDGTAVAVETAANIDWDGTRWGQPRLRLFDTTSGRMTHELLDHDLRPAERVGGLAWSIDGRFVVAGFGLHSDGPVPANAWDARTGRHRLRLGEMYYRCLGIVALPSGQLVTGSDDGLLRFWALPATPEIQPVNFTNGR